METMAVEQKVDVQAALERGHLVYEVIDTTGDSKFEWNPNNAAEMEAARTMFDSLTKSGHRAYRLSADGTTGEVVSRFNDIQGAGRVMFRPAMVGG